MLRLLRTIPPNDIHRFAPTPTQVASDGSSSASKTLQVPQNTPRTEAPKQVGYAPPPLTFPVSSTPTSFRSRQNAPTPEAPTQDAEPCPPKDVHESSQKNNLNASLNADAPVFQPKNASPPYQVPQSPEQVQVHKPKSPTASSTATPVDMLTRAMLEFHLPRPEQMKFDGSAKNFQAFMSSFKCKIADKAADPSLKLTYMIHHCSGDA